MDLSAVKTSYARWAPVYDRTFGAVTSAGRKTAVRFVNSQGGPDVLEVGVGTGLALEHYARDLNVTGIDFSDEMLAKAKARVSDLGLNQVAALRQMDARALDFPDESFDSVVAMHIMSVVPDPRQVLSEMARVCKPGGHILITNHFAGDDGVLGWIEKVSAPLANLLGWHPDFRIETVLGEPSLVVEDKQSLPPMGLMTFLLLRKTAPGRAA